MEHHDGMVNRLPAANGAGRGRRGRAMPGAGVNSRRTTARALPGGRGCTSGRHTDAACGARRTTRENPTMTRLSEEGFYAWAYGDLLANTTRGVLAEYLVATALGLCDTPRIAWNRYDLQIDDAEASEAKIRKVGVEVKSAAYMQAWTQTTGPSVISFDIAPAAGWDHDTDTHAAGPVRSAAVYVFCLLFTRGPDRPDPLDVDQWEFYVLPTSVLNREKPTQKRIRLEPLKDLQPTACTYAGLADAIRAAVKANRREAGR